LAQFPRVGRQRNSGLQFPAELAPAGELAPEIGSASLACGINIHISYHIATIARSC
jgi:hypothetical protein